MMCVPLAVGPPLGWSWLCQDGFVSADLARTVTSFATNGQPRRRGPKVRPGCPPAPAGPEPAPSGQRAHRSHPARGLARAPLSARPGCADPGIPELRAGTSSPVQNERVIEADRQPGILARMLGPVLQRAREAAGLSYGQAAARLGCEADWLVRVETGFAAADPAQVARILAGYGVRGARAAGTMTGMARRAASPPPAGHTSRLSAAGRDVLLAGAEATLAQVHGFLLIPYLAQTEGYFRQIAPGLLPGRDVDQEQDLLGHRQAHRPAGVTRLLEVIIDESALVRLRRPAIMAGQIRHLLAMAASPHATVRVIPSDAVFWESRGHNFDVLSFAGTTDRIGVCYYPVLGAELAAGDLYYDLWARIQGTSAASLTQSRAILGRHLAALS